MTQQASFDHIHDFLAEQTAKSSRRPAQPHFWQVENALAWVTIGKETYRARVLEYRYCGDFDGDWCKLELTKTVNGWNGPITSTWVHPEPVQSYKLRKRVE